jgi:hypothetical protein
LICYIPLTKRFYADTRSPVSVTPADSLGARADEFQLKHRKTAKPDLEKITVNSSPDAVGASRRMGFIPTSEEQLVNGVRFVPMGLSLSERNAALVGD